MHFPINHSQDSLHLPTVPMTYPFAIHEMASIGSSPSRSGYRLIRLSPTDNESRLLSPFSQRRWPVAMTTVGTGGAFTQVTGRITAAAN